MAEKCHQVLVGRERCGRTTALYASPHSTLHSLDISCILQLVAVRETYKTRTKSSELVEADKSNTSASVMASDSFAYWHAYLKVLNDGGLDYESYFRRLQDLTKSLFSTVIDIAVVDFQDTGWSAKIDITSSSSVDIELIE